MCEDICGDGKVANSSASFCDDSNTVSNDGCSSNCVVEVGYKCSGGTITTAHTCIPICSDGRYVSGKEGCDDGNKVGGDGCSVTCRIETGMYCSGGNINSPSVCRDICGDG